MLKYASDDDDSDGDDGKKLWKQKMVKPLKIFWEMGPVQALQEVLATGTRCDGDGVMVMV